MNRTRLMRWMAALALAAAVSACGDAQNYACAGSCAQGGTPFEGTIGGSSESDAETQCIARLGCATGVQSSCICAPET
jgi:hypothetical protein